MSLFLFLFAAPFVLVTAWLMLELALGLFPLRSRQGSRDELRAVVVVPAHDEGAIISKSIAALVEQADGAARILLVADNCSDDTASLARKAGVEVIERNEPSRRGKGFALAFARDHLALDPPDVVLIVDSDCSIDRNSIERLGAVAVGEGRPVQAINLLRPEAGLSTKVAVGSFAFMIKNLIRQRGLQRLAGAAHLTGTGMAFPWALFARAPLATSNIVEDLELGVSLARDGRGALLVEDAHVRSDAAPEGAALGQRSRWEGGYLATAFRSAPRVMLGAVTDLRPRLLGLGFDLMVPPLALLLAADVAVLMLLATVGWLTGASLLPAIMLGALLAIVIFILGIAWARYGRDYVTAGQLLLAPVYLLWKLPMYLGILRKGGPGWIRTGR